MGIFPPKTSERSSSISRPLIGLVCSIRKAVPKVFSAHQVKSLAVAFIVAPLFATHMYQYHYHYHYL